MNKSLIKSASVFVLFGIAGIFIWYSCEQGVSDHLIELQAVPDTNIIVGSTLDLDLTEYYATTGNFSRHPNIVPTIEDTSIARLNYNPKSDCSGSEFSILGIKVGSTTINLHLTWMDADNTVEAYQDKSFILTVVQSSYDGEPIITYNTD